MKHTLLFAILAFSLSAFAQHTPANFNLQDWKAKSLHNTKRDHQLSQTIEILNQHLTQQSGNLSSRDLLDLVARYDSIYAYAWDSLAYEWYLVSRTIDIDYNAANLPTSVTVQNLVGGTTWENAIQIVTTYDANNNQTSQLIRLWGGTSWTNYFQSTFTYDANNNQTSETDQFWTGFSWLNISKYIYTYDANHHVLTEIDQSWDNTDWLNSGKYTYTYDANGNQLSDLNQYWDDVNAVWINANQLVYTYDANHNQLTSTYQFWNGLSWDNNQLITRTFDGSNHLTTEVFQNWDGTQWVNTTRNNNTYTNGDLTYTLIQNWSGTNWDNAGRINNTYNGSHLLTKSFYEIWDGSSWLKSTLAFNSYDNDDLLTGDSNRSFDADGALIIEGDSTQYYFQAVSGLKETANEDATLTISPNPSTGKFIFTSAIGLGEISIYNSVGGRVYFTDKANGLTRTEINLEGYSSGMYLAIIKDGEKTTTRKIVIQ